MKESQGICDHMKMNVAGAPFNTVLILLIQNSFYHILCLTYFMAKYQQILDCICQ